MWGLGFRVWDWSVGSTLGVSDGTGGFRASDFGRRAASLDWVAVKELKLSYHHGYI